MERWMKPAETKEKFIEMRAEGYSYLDIEKALGVSKTTLIKWSNDLQIELKNFSTVRMDYLCQQYSLTKEARIKLLGELLGRVNNELSSRDLSKVSTEKLFELTLKLTEAHGKERADLTFWQEPTFRDIFKKESWSA